MKGKKRKARKQAIKKGIDLQVALVLGAAFLLLTAIVYKMPHLLIPLDAVVRDAFSPLQTYSWVQVFLVITELGGGVGIIGVALAFSALARLSPAQILRLAAVLGAVAFVCRVVKAFTERVRPEAVLWLEPISAFSFPSGHASTAGALYGFIGIYLYHRTRRIVFLVVPFVVAFLVGISRIVLGAHHFSDIVGGFLLAGAVLAAAAVFPFEKIVKKYG